MLSNYFFKYSNDFLDDDEHSIVLGLKNSSPIKVGDVIKIFYSKKGSSFFFEGFCLQLVKGLI